MSSRKDLKEQRRNERLEAERRMAQQERRRLRLRLAAGAAGLVIVAALVVALQPWQSSSSSSSSETLAYDAGGLQERIERAGLREGGTEHIHPKVLVSVRGESVPVPANIGIGGEHAPMHTHEPNGVVHVEGEPDPTLAEFMALWGVRLTPRELGPYATNGRERVRMWVKDPGGKSFEEVPVRPGLALKDRMEIYLGFGTDAQRPIT